MAKQKLDPAEAVIYLAENYPPPVPEDLQEAKYAAQGFRSYKVGMKGALTMIEKHDPNGKFLTADLTICKADE